MNTMLRERGIVTVHDQVVSLVVQRWAKAFHYCKVTIRTDLEQIPWIDPQQQSDIVGWHVSSAGNTIKWMTEVETNDSIKDVASVSAWKETVVRGIPFYLLVPRGLKESVQKLAGDGSVPVSGIYEDTFVNGLCQLC